MEEKPELLSRSRSFEGWTETYSHVSSSCNGPMRFSIFLPPQAEKRRVPILYFLSGLTCTEENFMMKAGAQRLASQYGLAIVVPDTSPRKTGIPGATERWDFGEGASFYVNATELPWSKHFKMYDYITLELPALIHKYFPVLPNREGISGHSMGGHGALVAALRQKDRYLSVSAFSPISAPSQCPWGQYAFERYLGKDKNAWLPYDAAHLMSQSKTSFPLLIDVGTDDKFLKEQLCLEKLEEAAATSLFPLKVGYRAGYDHSYYFVASFLEDHFRFHAEVLNLF